MSTRRCGPKTIDDYIAAFPHDVQTVLRRIRTTIRDAAPGAKETISYKIPAFTLHGGLVYFAAYRKHVGLYPAPRGTSQFQNELSPYKAAKATVRFPLDKPIPFNLIREIVRFRIKENSKKANAKKK